MRLLAVMGEAVRKLRLEIPSWDESPSKDSVPSLADRHCGVATMRVHHRAGGARDGACDTAARRIHRSLCARGRTAAKAHATTGERLLPSCMPEIFAYGAL